MSLPRRDVLRIATFTLLGAAGAPALARAERVRILDGRGPEGPAGPHEEAPEIRRLGRTLRLGGSTRHGALAVHWVHGVMGGPIPPLATLDEARAAGSLLVTERDRATVPELVVDNRGKGHVLLLAGEILVGGKQNRVLRDDLLLPPLSGPRLVAVYCVEQGRWNEGRRDFESKSSFAQPGLRREVMERADQAQVWSRVARAARAAAAPSATGSYQQVFEQPEVRAHLADAERELARPAADTVGAVAFAGGRFLGLDAFAEAGLFARLWPKLLRAHAVETYGRPAAGAPEGKDRVEAQAVLAGLAEATAAARPTVGAGRVLDVRAWTRRGTALVHLDAVVHLAIL